jgi:hypothetical protein
VVNFFAVIFEGNAKEIVKEINSNPPFLYRAGHFIESIIHEVRGCSFSSFQYVSRNFNFAAHTLSREADSF